MPECPVCGAAVGSDATACPSCDHALKDATASFEPIRAEKVIPVARGEAAEGPVLVVRKGPQPGERFFIDRPRLSIGRDPESDVFLNDMTVSRTHALVEKVGDTVTVSDVGSLNGTYVNGVLVDAAELHHCDSVQIGTFQMVFLFVPEGGQR